MVEEHWAAIEEFSIKALVQILGFYTLCSASSIRETGERNLQLVNF